MERQFKNLDNEDLTGIEETLPSLMNGLRLVWIISRHYKTDDKMQNLISTITNEIADKVRIILFKYKYCILVNQFIRPPINIHIFSVNLKKLDLIKYLESQINMKLLFIYK